MRSADLFQPHPAFPPEVAHRAPPAGHWPPAWAVAWGDDRFGLWADLEVGRVVQRFRWIEPGSFLMGSPKTEPERSSDEGPQHRVTLTQGFWLADTACTQALWLAVVGGENPSRFKGSDDLPVDNVSWDDVMEQFVPKLQVLLPEGVEAALPSEAQWEYACRTGTHTPFSFGKQINPAQVNYNGNQPYNDGQKGEYREKTVPVKALPANRWGLFQMHGNVWEWCLDERRTYTDAEAVDPLGAVGDGPRALRGGAWFYNARHARTTFRYVYERDGRWFYFGFRVALKLKPSPGA
ncbi:sulfatase-modifying factor protein [Vitreoscilla filiformis]|uniref:Sulfatase-modifying factor protein n=1 Tax=Vitreoscilla filiformis TaxID=63 RepID=A0A221KH16_VITFI|nr:formylglycine-generating enzyme family protein [Vitreoscilla filiformis]ASM78100.1 sulfatase-modifying factor protein [Vitreoscilla filiformis]